MRKRHYGFANRAVTRFLAGLAGGEEDDLIQSASVTLNDAQIKALPTTPFTLVAAPGAGKVNLLVMAALVIDVTAGAYDNLTEESSLFSYIGHPSNARVSDQLYKTLLLQEDGAVQLAVLTPGHDIDDSVTPITALNTLDGDLSVFENRALTLNAPNAPNGNFTGGNAANTIKATVYYIELDVS